MELKDFEKQEGKQVQKPCCTPQPQQRSHDGHMGAVEPEDYDPYNISYDYYGFRLPVRFDRNIF